MNEKKKHLEIKRKTIQHKNTKSTQNISQVMNN